MHWIYVHFSGQAHTLRIRIEFWLLLVDSSALVRSPLTPSLAHLFTSYTLSCSSASSSEDTIDNLAQPLLPCSCSNIPCMNILYHGIEHTAHLKNQGRRSEFSADGLQNLRSWSEAHVYTRPATIIIIIIRLAYNFRELLSSIWSMLERGRNPSSLGLDPFGQRIYRRIQTFTNRSKQLAQFQSQYVLHTIMINDQSSLHVMGYQRFRHHTQIVEYVFAVIKVELLVQR